MGNIRGQLQYCCSKSSRSMDRQGLLKALPASSCACFPREDILATEFINSKSKSQNSNFYI